MQSEFFFSITMAARTPTPPTSSRRAPCTLPAHGQLLTGLGAGMGATSLCRASCWSPWAGSFSTLNYISLAFLTFSLVLALFLKRPSAASSSTAERPCVPRSRPELHQMNPGPAQAGARGPAGPPAAAWRTSRSCVRSESWAARVQPLPQLRLWSLVGL